MISIKIDKISKSYNRIKALNNIELEISDGELFGFIGPDGAGKTTLFRILTTLLIPDSGKATLLGYDSVKDYKKIRRMLGYMPGKFSLYEDLTVEENLKFFASIFKTTIEENYYLIKDIYSQIEPFKTRRAGKLSGGMKQKLALSCALIHKPKILILDEPTTGVDAVSRKEFWEMLKHLKNQDITIVVSTPYMDEASLCDRVALIQDGSILKIDEPNAIVNCFDKQLYAIKSDNLYSLSKVLKSIPTMDSVYPFGEYFHYTDQKDSINIIELKEYINSVGIQNTEIMQIKPNIEDCFMKLMSKKG